MDGIVRGHAAQHLCCRRKWKNAMGKKERRKFARDLPEFGEGVMYFKPNSLGVYKSESRWEKWGIFVGIRVESRELLVMTEGGVIKIPGLPWKFSKTNCKPGSHIATRGMDNKSVLKNLGYSDKEIKGFYNKEVIAEGKF